MKIFEEDHQKNNKVAYLLYRYLLILSPEFKHLKGSVFLLGHISYSSNIFSNLNWNLFSRESYSSYFQFLPKSVNAKNGNNLCFLSLCNIPIIIHLFAHRNPYFRKYNSWAIIYAYMSCCAFRKLPIIILFFTAEKSWENS